MQQVSSHGHVAAPRGANGRNSELNRLGEDDRPAHGWYRFVLSYPPHLVRSYIAEFGLEKGHIVLDPFCGTGTTVVECRKRGIGSIGIEPNPMPFFATSVKVDWTPDPRLLLAHAEEAADKTRSRLRKDGIIDGDGFFELEGLRHTKGLRTLSQDARQLLLKNSISPLPLHKTLVLLETLDDLGDDRFIRHERLALAKALVSTISNLHFGPEVGVGPPKVDAPVMMSWLSAVREIAADLRALHRLAAGPIELHQADSRELGKFLRPHSIDAVITSPPYPNEKDYTRTTRLESVLLGFLSTRADLRRLKEGLIRSNTRNVFKGDADDGWVRDFPEIERIAGQIEARRLALGKTSGFERLYPRVAKLYFGGMARHLGELRSVLRPGARLAYVVGDQASYLRVMIQTGRLLGEIAQRLGYELVRTDLFRTRLATATRVRLREEVVVLRWPG